MDKVKKRTKRRLVRYSILASNVLLLMVVVVFMINQHSSATSASGISLSSSSDATAANPLDIVSSSAIAATVAHITNLPEATAVQDQANSDAVNTAWSQSVASGSGIIQKPQVVSTALKSDADIQYYTVHAGDTLSSLAVKFGVTSDSIRWSNGLSAFADSLTPGTKLTIPPVNGIAYTVKPGDTAESLAQKYYANAQAITSFNDAELSGLKVGKVIVIPNGRIQSLYTASYNNYGGFAFGSSAIYGYNGYDAGNCTWYAANMRAKIGRPIPANLGNAITWVKAAQLAGIPTGNSPQTGAVYWVPPNMLSGYLASYGHVGFVNQVLPDGSVQISSMNVDGLYSMETKTLTPAQAAQYTYIY